MSLRDRLNPKPAPLAPHAAKPHEVRKAIEAERRRLVAAGDAASAARWSMKRRLGDGEDQVDTALFNRAVEEANTVGIGRGTRGDEFTKVVARWVVEHLDEMKLIDPRTEKGPRS